jgi:outer membrane protein TolC
MKVSARLEKIKLDQLRAQNILQIDRERFNHLLGRNLQDRIALEAVSPPDEAEINLREMEAKALAQRPEIKGAAARLQQIKLEKRIRLAEYIPNVSVGAVYIGLPGFNNDALPRSIFAPGIFINYNAFDWGRRAFLAKAQAKSERAANLNLASIKDEVLIDLHAQANKLTEARLATRTTKYERTVALEDLRVSFNRYKFTAEKLSDVLASVNGLAEANNSYHQALIAFWEAKAEFERAVGQQVRN